MRKIALIVTTMSAYYSVNRAPLGKYAGAALSIYALKLHSVVHSVSLPTQRYDPFYPDRCAG
jgi:hypothetical protein